MIDARTKEKVDILAGERGDRKEAAARLKHLQAMVGSVPAETTAVPVTAAPTMEQYNALLEDVRRLHAAFNALRVLLR